MSATAHLDMQLRELLPGLAPAPPPLDVTGIAMHSGDVVPGGLFLACAGGRDHGLRFLDDALERGAAVIAWEPAARVPPPSLPGRVLGLEVPDLHRRLGEIADRFYGAPSAAMTVAGITGTNGKTTVAWLTAQALDQLGRRAAYMGTLGYGLAGRLTPDSLTTPGCVTVHRRLRELADAGASDVAAEVSSHALDQGRVDGVRFRVAAFTNLSHDHLDYHRDLEHYAEAKARLFLDAAPAHAVINLNDAFGRRLARQLAGTTRLVSVAAGPGNAAGPPATLRARRLAGDAGGQRLRLSAGPVVAEFSSPLLGAFNVENVAVAAGILVAEGFALEQIAGALSACTAPPGRMERITSAGGPEVIVDFAHTPEALRRVLEALRPHATGRIWCVFGCGGERDKGKRPLMGAEARRLADRIVLTDDNPRGEDPEAIIAAVLQGSGRGPGVEVIRDRAEAIRYAIRAADPADLVLIAGKGHEATQVMGGEVRAFSDQAVARQALAEVA